MSMKRDRKTETFTNNNTKEELTNTKQIKKRLQEKVQCFYLISCHNTFILLSSRSY